MDADVRSRRRRALSSLAFALVLVVVAVVFRRPLMAWFGSTETPGAVTSVSTASASAAASEIDHWTCSMHPSVRKPGPGKCPICGMDLIPVTKAQQEQGEVIIDEARRQLIGVRSEPVVEASIQQSLRAVGQITYDESKLADVTLKVQGFVTNLFVNRTGQRVTVGQPLLSLYSPELYNAQQDFLLATRGASAGASGSSGRGDLLGHAARQRLHLLGLSDVQIAGIQKNDAPLENVTIGSPASGFVIEKNVVQGAAVDPGMRLFRIAALDKVWVEADVYEGDLAHVRVGHKARVTLDYVPGRSYEAKVAYLYPFLDPKNRTGRVRVELANERFELRPGMYASVEIATDASPRLQVPAPAVVYTGPRRLVFLDLGHGHFRPQEVQIGREANGKYEVLAGLHAGDQVATSGVFLIAAEARISTAAKYWDDSRETRPASDAGTSAPAPPVAPVPRTEHSRRAPVLAPAASSVSAPPPKADAPVYTCTMHPEIRSPVPGKCPICGMELVPVPSGGTP